MKARTFTTTIAILAATATPAAARPALSAPVLAAGVDRYTIAQHPSINITSSTCNHTQPYRCVVVWQGDTEATPTATTYSAGYSVHETGTGRLAGGRVLVPTLPTWGVVYTMSSAPIGRVTAPHPPARLGAPTFTRHALNVAIKRYEVWALRPYVTGPPRLTFERGTGCRVAYRAGHAVYACTTRWHETAHPSIHYIDHFSKGKAIRKRTYMDEPPLADVYVRGAWGVRFHASYEAWSSATPGRWRRIYR